MRMTTHRYLSALVVAVLAVAAVFLLRPWAQTGGGGQSELWAIASQLHAPGDTTTQTAATSTVSSAWQIRAQIQQLLDKGLSERAILQVMEQDYGPTVLANPAFAGFGALVWLLPGAGVAVALAAYGQFLRRKSGRETVEAGVSTPVEDRCPTAPNERVEDWRAYL